MGKRKRTADDSIASPSTPSFEVEPCLSALMGSSRKVMPFHAPASNRCTHKNLNITSPPPVKRSRNHFDHHYSRRCQSTISVDRGSTASLRDKISFWKNHMYSCGNERGNVDAKGRVLSDPGAVCSSSCVRDPVTDVCKICDRSLRRQTGTSRDLEVVSDVSVVAVLVCGHAYHAECLEQRTCHDDRHDPPCPACSGSAAHVDISD